MTLNNKTILITGGTGSFGKHFTRRVLKSYPKIKKLIIFSRDELKQYEMSSEFSKYQNIRYLLGDIRDLSRVKRALEGVDIVVHAAALKQVPAAEYNPFEFIKTNVMGTQNMVDAALDSNVRNFVALSTDKASSPANLYGASKLCADKLVVAGNNITGDKPIKFSVVRYGNVLGSRGSVLPAFLKQKENKTITITDKKMTRFNISLNEGVDMVIWALKNAVGSEIFVPKIPSYKITDMAKAIAPDCKIEIVGIRPGEKVHEEMISVNDSENTIEIGKYYAILPQGDELVRMKYLSKKGCQLVKPGFAYSSDTNVDFLTVTQIKELIKDFNK
tara:strand:- start:17560 stop:18552 length:993 start_codon:yes stop_codon:yes gene_type:complete